MTSKEAIVATIGHVTDYFAETDRFEPQIELDMSDAPPNVRAFLDCAMLSRAVVPAAPRVASRWASSCSLPLRSRTSRPVG